MEKIKNNLNGVLICFIIAVPCLFLGNLFPIIGGPVIGLLIGMIISLIWIDKKNSSNRINFTSKYILQTAVVLLGFGLNLNVIFITNNFNHAPPSSPFFQSNYVVDEDFSQANQILAQQYFHEEIFSL